MARDNRKENREAAKKAGNENKSPDGTDFSDLLKEDEYTDEEDVQEIEKQEDENENEEEGDENADKSEGEKPDAKSVEKKAEEEGKGKAIDDKTKVDDKKADEVAKGEKTAEELKAEEDAKKLETKPEPTAEEKKALEDEAKKAEETARAAADAEKAKAKAEPEKPSDTSKPLSDEEAAKLFSDWRGETEILLAEHVYKLTEENVAELNENPAAFIPKAMSRVYLDSISAAFQQFVTYLPRMVSQVLEQQAVIKEQDEEFFKAWPQLKTNEKGRETVIRMGSAYRSQNPGATKEDFINEVGAQAMVALRLTPELGKTNGDAAKANGADGKEKPFKPASNAPASSSEKKLPINKYSQLAEEFGQEVEEEVDDN